ncbi:MAG: CarD family transcriptional regulator [Candidatus Desulfofervidaceae bacterium]|nr:CarD family transcriptional regulator [Candidatus Desulfofervidaceae bacterium]
MFKVGDLAVYPAHGIGVIEAIETKELSGMKKQFYIMRILENDMIIMIPTDNVKTVGLRPILSKEEVPKVYAILQDRSEPSNSEFSWNKRYRDYVDRLKTGSVCEVAEVLRDLVALREEKELSFGEKKLLETARKLLVKELSIAQECSEELVDNKIKQILNL